MNRIQFAKAHLIIFSHSFGGWPLKQFLQNCFIKESIIPRVDNSEGVLLIFNNFHLWTTEIKLKANACSLQYCCIAQLFWLTGYFRSHYYLTNMYNLCMLHTVGLFFEFTFSLAMYIIVYSKLCCICSLLSYFFELIH